MPRANRQPDVVHQPVPADDGDRFVQSDKGTKVAIFAVFSGRLFVRFGSQAHHSGQGQPHDQPEEAVL